MPDDHSKSVPPLPIPNRTVKRLRANDSAATSVKVGHRQAFIRKPLNSNLLRGFCFAAHLLTLSFVFQSGTGTSLPLQIRFSPSLSVMLTLRSQQDYLFRLLACLVMAC